MHGQPPDGSHRRRVRRRRRRRQLPHGGTGVLQQAIKRQIQPREHGVLAGGRSNGVSAPGGRQGGSQVGLLGQQVGGPVTHAAGFNQQHQRVGAQQVAQHRLTVGKPRQPRLHAVEHLPLGKTFPVLGSPRLLGDEFAGPLTDAVVGQQFAAGEHLDLSHVDGGPLVGDRELGQSVDIVAPQVDAHRNVGGGRKHVHDRAPHRHLATVLDLVLTAVPHAHQLLDQFGGVDPVSHAHHHRPGISGCRIEALHQGAPEPPPPPVDPDAGRGLRQKAQVARGYAGVGPWPRRWGSCAQTAGSPTPRTTRRHRHRATPTGRQRVSRPRRWWVRQPPTDTAGLNEPAGRQ